MPVRVNIDKDRQCVVIELPMNKPRPSATGKTTLIATSHGLVSGAAVYSGRPVMVAASAFIYPDQPPQLDKSKAIKTTRRNSELKTTERNEGGSSTKRGRKI